MWIKKLRFSDAVKYVCLWSPINGFYWKSWYIPSSEAVYKLCCALCVPGLNNFVVRHDAVEDSKSTL